MRQIQLLAAVVLLATALAAPQAGNFRTGTFQAGNFRAQPQAGNFQGFPQTGNFQAQPRAGNFRAQQSRQDDNFQIIRNLIRSAAGQGFTLSPNTYILEDRNEYYSPSDYLYYYVLSDGTAVSQRGGLRDDGVFYQQGFFSYITPENSRHTTSYIADDKGYQPSVKVEEPGDLSGNAAFCSAAICG